MIAVATRLVLAACVLGLLAAPAPAPAQQGAAAVDLPGGLADEPDAGQWMPWLETLEETRRTIREERARLAAAEIALAKAIRDQYPRGAAKAALEREVVEARAALEEAEARYPDLLDQARRAGVPARVLLEYEELPTS